MRDDDHRCQPVEIRFAKAVEMDNVWLDRIFEIFEKALRIGQVVPAGVLPLEGEVGFNQANAAIAQHRPLFAPRRRSEGYEMELHTRGGSANASPVE